MTPHDESAPRTRRRGQPRCAAAAVAACVLTGLLACGPDTDAPTADGPSADGSSGAVRHVVLISIDTLRADRLGCYGYDRPTSPAIDRLAEQGTTFTSAVAVSPWTLPSHASLLTGLYPHRHGVTESRHRLTRSLKTLPQQLRAAGFSTGALVNSHFLGNRHGLDRGFDDMRLFPERPKAGAAITDAAVAWIDEHKHESFLLFVHYYDVHSGYIPADASRELLVQPYAGDANGTTGYLQEVRSGERVMQPEDLAYVSQLYDAEIHELDGELARLFDGIDALLPTDATLLALTSDHGEEFLEHGSVLHGRSMYREMLEVPLIVRGPGFTPGRRVDGLASHVDLVPTIRALLGQPVLADLDGIDLRELGQGPRPPPRIVIAEADHNNEQPNSRAMARDQRFKLCIDDVASSAVLYDLFADPAERTDVSAEHPEMLRQLQRRLQLRGTGASADEAALDEADLQRMRELGYLGDR